MIKLFTKVLALIAMLVLPVLVFAQEAPAKEKGLDQKIDAAFKPIADAVGKVVFFEVPLSSTINFPFIVLLLIAGALFFTIYFSFVNIRHFGLSINVVRGKYDYMDANAPAVKTPLHKTEEGDIPDTIKDESKTGEVNHFQALATAVSGTLGLGNIAGVAVAIAMGGPGATLWMMVAGLLGMTLKFVECTLGVRYRDMDPDGTVHGGPMYYLTKGLKGTRASSLGKPLAILFAILCVGGSLGGGNAFQANQATQQVINSFGLESGSSGFIIGIMLAILTGAVIIGGIKRIAQVTEKLVPFMSILYMGASLVIIFMNFSLIDDAVREIFSQAFTPDAGLGGVAGVLIMGFRRAAFSNEAGAGSAAIAHSAVKTRYPASEGIVSLQEPFLDTVVMCTITALIIVIYNLNGAHFVYGNAANLGGVELSTAAFNAYIPKFSFVLTISILLFAFATMISWSYYGLQSWKFLFGRSKAADLSYKMLFLAFVVIGSSASLGSVIDFSDAMIIGMVFPNMVGLLFLFPKAKEELNKYLKAIRDSKLKKIFVEKKEEVLEA
jgi:alanine or glycine:cation symporter, AGCS family